MFGPQKDSSEMASALADLNYIREIVESDSNSTNQVNTIKIEVKMLLFLLICDLIFLGYDLVDHTISSSLLATTNSLDLQMIVIGQLFITLTVLIGVIYGFVYLRSQSLQSQFSKTIKRYFSFLHLSHFCSDLVLKFLIMTTLILLNHPEVLVSLFMAYLADYMIQGRFFRMPRVVQLICGTTAYSMAIYFFIYNITSLIPVFVGAAIICATSLAYSLKLVRRGQKV